VPGDVLHAAQAGAHTLQAPPETMDPPAVTLTEVPNP
jgi:hypothetical protein